LGLDFGDYKVTRKIAEGGMGAVYLAEHPAGMKKVVKFMLGEALKVPAIRKRFETECLAAKRFKGRSGIVEIDSFGERNGELYLVMEFLDGITLEEHIRQNVRLTEHHTFHVIVLCLRALSILHAEEIIHRDLKPANVFLRQTDERPWDPVLLDFGIVHDNKQVAGEFRTREGQTIGTLGFMATEQYGRANRVTPATDVFACAVMVWLMVTGELPWGVADNEYAQYDRQLNNAPTWPADVQLPYAEGWKEILVAALSPDPEKRPASAQLLALLLAQRLAPIPPHVPSGLEMLTKLAPRFLQHLPPELETVRQANGRIEVAAFWPPRSSGSPVGPMTPSGINLDAIRVSAVMAAAPAPASAPTVSARPAAVALAPSAPPPMTTLSGAVATSSSPVRAPSRVRLALLGVGVAVLAIGAVSLGAAHFGARSSTSQDAIEQAPTPAAAGRSTVGVEAARTQAKAPEVAPTPIAPSSPPATVPPVPTGGTSEPIQAAASAVADPSGSDGKAPSAHGGRAIKISATPDTHRDNSTRGTHASAKAPETSAPRPTVAPSAIGPSAPATGSGTRRGSDTFDPDAIKE
jgi:serine/threonine-protein kinase